MNASAYPSRWRAPSLVPNPWLRYGLLLLALAYLYWASGSLDIDWHRISNGIPRAANMFARMIPPNFSRWELLVRGVGESIEMALAASFVGMILAIPLGICAASNLVPAPVYLVARAVLVLSRTFHEIIIAIFFVKIFGFGPLAGILTLVVASMSFIGKMLAEDIENMPAGQLEAVRAQRSASAGLQCCRARKWGSASLDVPSPPADAERNTPAQAALIP